MTQPPPTTPSKLFIRSEVLAVMDYLYTVEEPTRQDKLKQYKRLQSINDEETVQRILVKELQRASNSRMLQVVLELLMELGRIEVVQEPLWAIIQSSQSSDELRDAANLILRQLGDQTDPNLYLEYLDDPAGLINRETERMLEVSTRNPEALIDFIDFIFSLPVDEQGNLIRSLQTDYPSEYLLNIYMPALLAQPPLETQELILANLGEIRTKRTALFLHDNLRWLESDPRLSKTLKKAINSLKIAGFYREERFEEFREALNQPHPLATQTQLYECYATIPDGIGNQGIIVSRERENGDITMMSVAVNDLHGIIDSFGFHELSKADFHKLIGKFHEESSKIHAPAVYCLDRLREAEALNRVNRFRIPYEYTCWKVILDDVATEVAEPLDKIGMCLQWANQNWEHASINLYQHPDFSTWFLEEGDHPVVTSILKDTLNICAKAMAEGTSEDPEMEPSHRREVVESAFVAALDKLAEALVHGLLSSEWREILVNRLADAAYLLNEQKATTFAGLAATEVQKLRQYQGMDTPLDGFILQYGRRCIEEDLLRLKQGAQASTVLQDPQLFEQLVDSVLAAWEV
jgi:hypothetical protein